MPIVFGWSNIFVRTLFASGIVFCTYNPYGRSYLHWVFEGFDLWVVKVFAGVGLVAAYWLMLNVTWLALGYTGTVLTLLVVATFFGALWQVGILPFTSWTVELALLVGLITFFSIGLSFSGLRYRLSRQVQPGSIIRAV